MNATGDGGAKVLCIGEGSRAVGKDIDRLSSLLPGVASPTSVYVSDEIEPGSSSSSSTRLMKCAHTLTEQTEYCSVCSRNAEVLQDVVFRSILESSDSACLTKLCVMSDVYTQFSTWASAIAMEYLQEENSYTKMDHDIDLSNFHGGLISVLTKPPMGRTTGLENLYALLSSHHSLVAANCILYRGVETSTTQLATASTPLQTNGTYGIACDLWPILCSTDATTTTASGCPISADGGRERGIYGNGYSTLQSFLTENGPRGDMQYHLWPLDICTERKKIIDVRTSLAALLKRLLKPKHPGGSARDSATTEYNALRSLSSNVHAMHLAYQELYPQCALKDTISSANYANLTFSSRQLRDGAGGAGTGSGASANCLSFADVTQTENDLSVALNWASPDVLWPYRSARTAASTDVDTSGIAGQNSDTRSEAGSLTGGSTHHRSVTENVHPALRLFPCNAVNVGHRGLVDDGDDDQYSVSVVSAGSRASKAGYSGRRVSQGSVASSQASMRSGASRVTTQRSGGGANSRNMYALTASMRQETETTDLSGAAGRQHSISAVVFDSPYGRQDCANICASSRQLLTLGAYRHLFGPAGSAFTSDELVDALEVVEGYCS